MSILRNLKRAYYAWRGEGPYYYECIACGRLYQIEQSKCPECGGEIGRGEGGFWSVGDPHPY